jgi:hypothetical protein
MVTTMRTLETTLPVLLVMAMVGCRQQPHDEKTQMMLDSAVSGTNVTIVRPKEAVRPGEAIRDFKELSTITQYDIDASQRLPSKEVVYVKPGEALRPSEKRQ